MKQSGENMQSKDIEVEAFWDEEALVWVASSNDNQEADTMEHLMQKLKILIPELLEAMARLRIPVLWKSPSIFLENGRKLSNPLQ